MLKTGFVALLSFFLPFNGSLTMLTGLNQNSPKNNNGIIEKMIVADGNVAMELDLNKLNGTRSDAKNSGSSVLRFDAQKNAFFTVIVFNETLRGPLPSSMAIVPRDSALLPAKLSASYDQLVVESMPFQEQYELAVTDAKTGFIFFNIEGHKYGYEARERSFTAQNGRMLISKEFANELGRPSDAGTVIGTIDIKARMQTIEITEVVDGEVKSETMPGIENAGTTPGPDVIVGDVFSLSQFGSTDTMVGLALGTTSCNYGVENLNWFALPNNDHPVIPQNLYRMSGGAGNDQRFEQIGQSSVKHAFTALTQNLCGLGCNGIGGSRLGSGCSDPYSAGLNAGPNLGSRAWINPFTGDFPRGDSGATNPNTHSGHSHDGTTHRILTAKDDLNTTMNSGATYWAEGQYVTPHEYAWCQTHPTECNMYNNVSYRQYGVTGTTSFSFSPIGSTVREKPAIEAWPGATLVRFEPVAGVDGAGWVGYKVTNPSPGVWHYEYAVYNQNIDRAIQSFEVPFGSGVTLDNIGFHAPPQHPASANDGTLGSAGFSSTPWSETQNGSSMKWNTETFAQNQNANAIRWGTMYNFRFDSNRPPTTTNATIGFYKTGAPITVSVMGPSGAVIANATVSGRVTASGGGVPYAIVTLTAGSTVLSARTTSLGYYRFDSVPTGATYSAEVFSKRNTFPGQNVDINDNISGLNFEAAP